MKHLNQTHRKLLSDLLKGYGKRDSFTLFKKSGISFSDFTLATRFLFDEKLAEENETHILLTETGKKLISRLEMTQEGQYKWREIPKNLKTNPIEVNEPYIPNIELLDKRTFNIKQPSVD